MTSAPANARPHGSALRARALAEKSPEFLARDADVEVRNGALPTAAREPSAQSLVVEYAHDGLCQLRGVEPVDDDAALVLAEVPRDERVGRRVHDDGPARREILAHLRGRRS